MKLDAELWAGGIILACLVLGATHGAAYLAGRAGAVAEAAQQAARNTIGAEGANVAGERAALQADSRLSAENQRLQRELDNARATLDDFRHATPAESRVGAGALVDAPFARFVVQCHERLRDASATLTGDCAGAPADRAADDQPVPPGSAPGP